METDQQTDVADDITDDDADDSDDDDDEDDDDDDADASATFDEMTSDTFDEMYHQIMEIGTMQDFDKAAKERTCSKLKQLSLANLKQLAAFENAFGPKRTLLVQLANEMLHEGNIGLKYSKVFKIVYCLFC